MLYFRQEEKKLNNFNEIFSKSVILFHFSLRYLPSPTFSREKKQSLNVPFKLSHASFEDVFKAITSIVFLLQYGVGQNENSNPAPLTIIPLPEERPDSQNIFSIHSSAGIGSMIFDVHLCRVFIHFFNNYYGKQSVKHILI